RGIVTARGNDARKPFLKNTDVWEGFVVFEEDVIPGLIFFDEVVFKEKCIEFRFRNDVFNVPYLRHEPLGLYVSCLGKVARYALADVFCLAHVDEVSICVEEFIYTRRRGEPFHYFRKR